MKFYPHYSKTISCLLPEEEVNDRVIKYVNDDPDVLVVEEPLNKDQRTICIGPRHPYDFSNRGLFIPKIEIDLQQLESKEAVKISFSFQKEYLIRLFVVMGLLQWFLFLKRKPFFVIMAIFIPVICLVVFYSLGFLIVSKGIERNLKSILSDESIAPGTWWNSML